MRLIGFLLFTVALASNISPSRIWNQLQRVMTEGVELVSVDLGRSTHGRTIMAYGITKIQGISQPPLEAELKASPSILFTTYFRPNDVESIELVTNLMQYLIRTHQQDYYISYVLENGIFWILPFLNIDAYQTFVYTNKLKNMPLNKKSYLTKNLNSLQNSVDCQVIDGIDVGIGVNLYYNFYPSSNKNACSPIYPGPESFSESETKAVRLMYQKFNITTVVYIQGYGNKWVEPELDIHHPLGFLYSDIRQKLKLQNYSVGTGAQLFPEENYQKSFLDWSAEHGALTFTYLYGSQSETPKNILDSQAKEAVLVFDLLIKKNSPVYNKWKSADNKILFVENICLVSFKMEVAVRSAEGQIILRTYSIIPGQILKVDFGSYFQLHSLDSDIQLTIKQTLIQESFQIYDLSIISVDKIEVKTRQQPSIQLHTKITLISFSAVFILLIIVWEKWKKKLQDIQFKKMIGQEDERQKLKELKT